MASKKTNKVSNDRETFVFNNNLIENLVEYVEENKIVSLFGGAGVGKTSIAKEISFRFLETHNVFWLDCSTSGSFNGSLKTVYEHLSKKKEIKFTESDFDAFLKESEFKSLIIMDNVDNLGLIREFIDKKQANVRFVITTREPKFNAEFCTVLIEGFDQSYLKIYTHTVVGDKDKIIKTANKLNENNASMIFSYIFHFVFFSIFMMVYVLIMF